MTQRSHVHPSDLHGVGRLSVEAVTQVTRLVENLHYTITQTPLPLGAARSGTTRGITGLVYRSIRGVTALVGGTLDAAMAGLLPLLRNPSMRVSSRQRDAVLAALNGVLGDHLAASGNPLAIAMQLRANQKFFAGEHAQFSKEAAELLLETGIIKAVPDLTKLADTRFLK